MKNVFYVKIKNLQIIIIKIILHYQNILNYHIINVENKYV